METLYAFEASPTYMTQLDLVNRRVLALIRHGEYEQPRGVPSAHLPYPLTERGRAQARAAARGVFELARAEQLVLDTTIDSSRMLRAWHTAELLGSELSALTQVEFRVNEFDALAERSVGALANLSVTQIEAILRADPRFSVPAPGWKRDSRYKLPSQGAESLCEAGARVASHLIARSRAVTHERGLKLFVGHGGAFRHAAHTFGLLSLEQVSALTLQHGAAIYLEHRFGADTDRVVHLAGEWQARSDSSHLD